MSDHSTGKTAAVSTRRLASMERKSLGTLHDQRFYAVRHMPGKPLGLPFERRPFNALIHGVTPLPDSVLREISLQLLRHGMRFAVCCGYEAERLGELVDELIDENDFSHEGRTVYTSVHDDETLAEAIDYFILPADLADTGLLVVLGEERDFRQAVKEFAQTTAGLRERIFPDAR